MTRRSFLKLGLLCMIWALVCPTYASAQPEAPTTTTTLISVATGTTRTINSIKLTVKRDSTPLNALIKLGTNRGFGVYRKDYSFGSLLIQLLDRRNADTPLDDQNPNDAPTVTTAEDGKYWQMFIGPTMKVARQGNNLRLVKTMPGEIQKLEYMPQGATDGVSKTKLRKQRPLVPLSIRSSTDPRIQQQLKTLTQQWVEPHVVFAYRLASDFDPGNQ